MPQRRRSLTPKEKQIVELFVNTGWENQKLADHLGMRKGTLAAHMENAKRKLHVNLRAELVVWGWSTQMLIEAEDGSRAIVLGKDSD